MDNTRQRILVAAHRLYSREGFRGATMRRIATEAGVNEVTLFRLFTSKDHLLASAIDWHTDLIVRGMSKSPLPAGPTDLRRELAEYLMTTLAGLLEEREAVRTSLGEWGHRPDLDERLMRPTNHVYDEVEHYLGAAAQAGLIRRDVNVVVVTEVILGTIFADGMLRQVLPERFPLDSEHSVDAYLDVILNGLLGAARND